MQVNQYSIRFIEKGLAGVSMSMIADKIGIKKPSLYKHFSSKDEIVEAMYQFLREQSKKNANINHQEKLLTFYKVIYSERSIQPMAARIVAEETERMIIATKQLFYAMEWISAVGFSMFPLSDSGYAGTFQDEMHILSTILVVLLSIVSLVMLIIAGAKRKEYFGVVERFSVFVAVGYNAVLGIELFRIDL